MLRSILHRFQSVVRSGLRAIGNTIARWTKPTAPAPVVSCVAELARSKPQLLAENLLHYPCTFHRR